MFTVLEEILPDEEVTQHMVCFHVYYNASIDIQRWYFQIEKLTGSLAYLRNELEFGFDVTA